MLCWKLHIRRRFNHGNEDHRRLFNFGLPKLHESGLPTSALKICIRGIFLSATRFDGPFFKVKALKESQLSTGAAEKAKENGHDDYKHRDSKDEKKEKSKDKSRRHSRSRSRDRKRRTRSRDRDRRRHSRSRSRERRRNSRSRSRDRRRRSRSKDRRRSRSRDRRRSKSRDRKRSRSRDRRRSRSRDRRRSRSRSKHRRRTRSRSRETKYKRRSLSPLTMPVIKPPKRELTAEERDARTVFCMQLSSRIRARDLEDFFSVVGKVSDVRLITDGKTRRSKGIGYVEFEDVESVPLALGLSNQKLLGVPIIVQPTLAEKNRVAMALTDPRAMIGPMRLYVGSLHFNITEEMLRSIFEPFGKIDHLQLIIDPENQRSKGYGFVTFHHAEDAKKALEQLNGFELAGRPMKVNHVTERPELYQGNSILDNDEMERAGIDLGATGRLALMAKLAEGTGLELPPSAANALSLPQAQVQHQSTPPIATQCFLLNNMFDPAMENNPNWADDIRDDVVDECNKHGGVLHIYVDRQSNLGNVYVKCPTIATAVAAVNSLHGRFFGGKMITAAYVPVVNYHSLFPDAMTASKLLTLGMRQM